MYFFRPGIVDTISELSPKDVQQLFRRYVVLAAITVVGVFALCYIGVNQSHIADASANAVTTMPSMGLLIALATLGLISGRLMFILGVCYSTIEQTPSDDEPAEMTASISTTSITDNAKEKSFADSIGLGQK